MLVPDYGWRIARESLFGVVFDDSSHFRGNKRKSSLFAY